MSYPKMAPHSVAVITGGASGIGLAAAKYFASLNMKIVIIDLREELLENASSLVKAAGAADVLARAVDVSDREAVRELEIEIEIRYGDTDILMNNAGIQVGNSIFGALESWQRTLAVNLWGVINGCQIFAPRMIERKRPGMIINTGSKQGITTPPGNPAYNVSKSGVKVFTEALSHELRNAVGGNISAHLLIPGFVFTDLTSGNRTEKPTGAWTPEETVSFMASGLERGDFYILCPDNEVSRELDEKRIAWSVGDIIENRPALSRWHPDYEEAYETFLKNANPL